MDITTYLLHTEGPNFTNTKVQNHEMQLNLVTVMKLHPIQEYYMSDLKLRSPVNMVTSLFTTSIPAALIGQITFGKFHSTSRGAQNSRVPL